MGPTTRNGLKTKKLRTENGEGSPSMKNGTVEALNGGSASNGLTSGGCLLLAPDEYKPHSCRTIRLRCPTTGTSACYVIDEDQELVWQIVQYRHEEFASILTPTEILPASDPCFILSPVKAFSLVLPFLLKHEEAGENGRRSDVEADNGQFSAIDIIGRWKAVLSIMHRVGEFTGAEDDLSSYRLDHTRLSAWISEKTRSVYEKLKTGNGGGLDDQFCREFAMKTVRHQLPSQLHDLVSL